MLRLWLWLILGNPTTAMTVTGTDTSVDSTVAGSSSATSSQSSINTVGGSIGHHDGMRISPAENSNCDCPAEIAEIAEKE